MSNRWAGYAREKERREKQKKMRRMENWQGYARNHPDSRLAKLLEGTYVHTPE